MRILNQILTTLTGLTGLNYPEKDGAGLTKYRNAGQAIEALSQPILNHELKGSQSKPSLPSAELDRA